MENNEKIELFEHTPVTKAIMILVIPTVLSSLVTVIYSLADTYFVGMLNDPVENAAVTFVATVILAFNAVNNLFGIGASSLMSRKLGEKDYQAVRKTSCIGFYASLFCSAMISICCIFFYKPLIDLLGADSSTFQATYEYMRWTVMCGAIPTILNVVMAYFVRAEGSALHASIGTMSGCLLNILLDPFFILPQFLNMGAEGAGLATFISNCIACTYFLILIKYKGNSTYVCLDPRLFSFDTFILKNIFIVGLPACIQNLLNVTGMTILNNMAGSYGTNAVAAMGICYKIYLVPLQIALGVSQGIMPLVSYSYSSKNYARMKETITKSLKIVVVFGICMTLILFINSRFFVHLFIDTKEVIDYGQYFLKGYSLGILFIMIDFQFVHVFQAIGNGKISLIFAILRKIILEIPFLLILDHFFPLYGLAYAQFLTEVILSIVGALFVKNLFNKLKESIN